jgi:hypothetical protein
MKSNIKQILGLIVFIVLTSLNAKAQLFQTRSEIIKDKGYNYTTGITDDGTKYIRYDTETRTNASGNYTMTKVMYFMNLDNGKEICYMWKILEPSSETNSNVAYYKSKYVEVAYMQWKDYENNVIYDIVSKDGICIITAWWDNKK